MGRPGKRHIIDPFRSTEMLCGLARVHHEHTVADLDLELCRRCTARLDELRLVMSAGRVSHVFEMPCSTCGAPKGLPCLTTTDQPSSGHAARVRLARALYGPKTEHWEQRTQRVREELALVLIGEPVQDARSLDRPDAPATTPESATAEEVGSTTTPCSHCNNSGEECSWCGDDGEGW
jgi:hypothetical protein